MLHFEKTRCSNVFELKCSKKRDFRIIESRRYSVLRNFWESTIILNIAGHGIGQIRSQIDFTTFHRTSMRGESHDGADSTFSVLYLLLEPH